MRAQPATEGDVSDSLATAGDSPLLREFLRLQAGRVRDAVTAPRDAYRGDLQVFDPATGHVSDEAMERANGMAGLAMTGGLAGVGPGGVSVGAGPIRAYHGSPHGFDRFSTRAIGTGEGAQAYGHGLYFAENESIADAYRRALSPPDTPRDVRTSLGPMSEALPRLAETDPTGYQGALEYHIRQSYKPPDKANEMIRGELGRTIANYEGGHIPMDERALADARAALHFMDRYSPEVAAPTRGGHMYEVQINADPEHFLQYDKPLSDQPYVLDRLRGGHFDAEIQRLQAERPEIAQRTVPEQDSLEAWLALAQDTPQEAALRSRQIEIDQRIKDLSRQKQDFIENLPVQVGPNRLGAHIVEAAVRTPEEAQRLAGVGIPGIRYLDAGSRGADGGSGTHNLVVFNDDLVEILRKYGIAGLAALGAGSNAVQNLGMMSMPQGSTQ
jgi:hypothetical protein